MTVETIPSVDDAPICHGCGLISHLVSGDNPICYDCFNRYNAAVGGGPLRVVTSGDTYHETPLCPAARSAKWWAYRRDESVMYDDLADRIDKCTRCHSFSLHGFDHYRGDDKAVIGHA